MKRISTNHILLALGLAIAAWSPAWAGPPLPPGTVIFDFSTRTDQCDPDFWNFYGQPTTDFGPDTSAEDGHGAFQAGNWTSCDLAYGESACQFMGTKNGGGIMYNQPLCDGDAGIDDADLDLSQGTGISVRVKLTLPNGDNPPTTKGTPGVRLQFQLDDDDAITSTNLNRTRGTIPGRMPTARNYVNRMWLLNGDEEWETVKIPFAGLDWSYDGAAIAGTNGLQLNDIRSFRFTWRRGPSSALVDDPASSNRNTLRFDEITLINDPPQLWADHDGDHDVDLADFGFFEECYGEDLTPTLPETVLYDFTAGDQGWTSFGIYTTDSGLTPSGSVGQGRFHIADFDVPTSGFGIGDKSPFVDLSAYAGMMVDVRMVDVPGEPPFNGVREFEFKLAIGETEFSKTFTATTDYQTYSLRFAELYPSPAPWQLSDPGLVIKLVVKKGTNTGKVRLDYDQVTVYSKVPSPCKPVDADRDNDVDDEDLRNLADCLLGPGVTTGFFPWCY
jgi:hypothetical protein